MGDEQSSADRARQERKAEHARHEAERKAEHARHEAERKAEHARHEAERRGGDNQKPEDADTEAVEGEDRD